MDNLLVTTSIVCKISIICKIDKVLLNTCSTCALAQFSIIDFIRQQRLSENVNKGLNF